MMPSENNRNGRLLVIDDDEEILALFKALLIKDNFEVDTSQSGQLGVAKFRDYQSYDAVLTDLKIGDITGLDVLKQIREIDSRVPVIIMTGYASTETAMEALRLGANDYLMKPVRSPDLLKSVRTQVSNYRLIKEVDNLHNEIEFERDKLKRSVLELTLLKQLAEQMASVVSYVGGFEAIMKLLVEKVGADVAVVYDLERRSVRHDSKSTLSRNDIDKIASLINENGVELCGEEINCSLDDFEGLNENLPEGNGRNFVSTVVVPIVRGGSNIGLMVAVSFSDEQFSEEWSEFIRQLSESASEFLMGIHSSIERQRHFAASVVEHTLDGIALLSLSTGAVLMNPVMRDLLSIPSDEAPKADELIKFLDIDSIAVWDELHTMDADDPSARIKTFRIDRIVQNKRISLNVAISMLPMAIHHEKSLMIVAHDIPRERAIEEMKNRLISNLTHEVRTPTAVIKEFMSLIMDGVSGPLTDTQMQYMQIMYTNIERLSRLIENLLTLARSESGGFTILLMPTELPPIIREVAESLEVKLRRKRIELNVSLPDELPLIYADRDAVTQILVNLIDNAFKYSPEDTVVTISAEDQGARVLVSVADQGYGIPEDQHDLIFERFQRLVDEDDPRFQEGIGLGLALVQDIVHRHGGDIWLRSKVGDGSVFFFSLHVATKETQHKPA